MIAILGLMNSPIGRLLIIVAALAAWTFYQREQAAGLARRACQAEQLQKTVVELQRQRDAAQDALDDAEKQAQQTRKEMTELEAERDKTISQLKNAGDTCRVPDATIKRLRDIR